VGNIIEINLAFARSSLCLVHFSFDGQDGPSPRVVDGEAGSTLIDDSCTPTDIDMTLSLMRSIKTSSKTFLYTTQLVRHTHSWLTMSGSGIKLDTAI
jgi:hypothetical protein